MNPNGRPKKKENEVLAPASFRLPPVLIEKMDKYIKEEGTTRSIFLRNAINEKINTKLSPENEHILSDLAAVFAPSTKQILAQTKWQNVYAKYLLEAFVSYLEKFSNSVSDEEDLIILPKSLLTAFAAEIAPLIEYTEKIEAVYKSKLSASDRDIEISNLRMNAPVYEEIFAIKDLYKKIKNNNYASPIMHKMVKASFDKLTKMADEREFQTNEISINKEEKVK